MDSFAVELDRELPGRDSGDAARRGRARGGSRAGRRHDQLRDRRRDQLRSPARRAKGGRRVSHDDAVRARFGATAEGVAAHAQGADRGGARARCARSSLRCAETSACSTSGTGAGTLALALAPLVGEVVGVDLVPELLEAARRNAPPNATFVEADAHRAAVRELHVRPRLLTADAPPRQTAGARAGGAGARREAGRHESSSTTRSRRWTRSRRSSSTGSSGGATRRTTAPCRTATSATSSRRTASMLVRSKQFTHRRELDFYLGLAGCTGDGRRAREGSLARRPRALRRRERLVPLRETLRPSCLVPTGARPLSDQAPPPRRAISRETRFGASACTRPGSAVPARDRRLAGRPRRRGRRCGARCPRLDHGAPEERAAQASSAAGSPRSRRSRDSRCAL